jgi:hypothetical protein
VIEEFASIGARIINIKLFGTLIEELNCLQKIQRCSLNDFPLTDNLTNTHIPALSERCHAQIRTDRGLIKIAQCALAVLVNRSVGLV